MHYLELSQELRSFQKEEAVRHARYLSVPLLMAIWFELDCTYFLVKALCLRTVGLICFVLLRQPSWLMRSMRPSPASTSHCFMDGNLREHCLSLCPDQLLFGYNKLLEGYQHERMFAPLPRWSINSTEPVPESFRNKLPQ